MSIVRGPDSAQNRDEAFEQMVKNYQEALLRMCYLHLRDQSLAEDAVQETFMKAYRSMIHFRGDSHEKTWLMRIAINTCRDINRNRWFSFVDRHVTPDMLPEKSAPFTMRDEGLVIAIMALPRHLRETFLLYYYQGMSTPDISQTLGISQSSVSGRLRRAREKVRTMLEKEGQYD